MNQGYYWLLKRKEYNASFFPLFFNGEKGLGLKPKLSEKLYVGTIKNNFKY